MRVTTKPEILGAQGSKTPRPIIPNLSTLNISQHIGPRSRAGLGHKSAPRLPRSMGRNYPPAPDFIIHDSSPSWAVLHREEPQELMFSPCPAEMFMGQHHPAYISCFKPCINFFALTTSRSFFKSAGVSNPLKLYGIFIDFLLLFLSYCFTASFSSKLFLFPAWKGSVPPVCLGADLGHRAVALGLFGDNLMSPCSRAVSSARPGVAQPGNPSCWPPKCDSEEISLNIGWFLS